MALGRASLMLMFASLMAFGQAQSAAGDVKGTVLDPTGAAISKAKLTITNAERGIARGGESDSQGEFEIPVLPPGVYRLRVEASGFTTKVLEGLTVRVGDIVSLSVQMTVSQMQTEIQVAADVPVVEAERVQQASTIELARIRDLPINRRNYLDFALLSPATADTTDMVDGTDYRAAQTPQSGISFGGGNGRGNAFSIDGVENYINSGGVRLSVSQEAVQEFQINRNTASTEFGWASGGTINVVTKSGTNDWRGSLFAFLRHKSIQARNYFDPQKSAFTRSQAGVTLGGPVKKDRTFLFAAFERLGRQETGFVPILQDRGAFNQLTASQQQLVNFFGASGVPLLQGLAQQARVALIPANSPFVTSMFNANSGTFPFSESTKFFSVKLDHKISERQNLYFRGNWAGSDASNSQFGALVAYNRGRSFSQWDGTGMLNHTLVLGAKTVVETRLMYNYNNLRVIPSDRNGPEINITGFGYFGRDIFLPSMNWERHYQAMQNWSTHVGRHDLKWGFDINPVGNRVLSETFFSGRFSFGEAVPLASVLASAANNPQLPTLLGQTLQQMGQAQLIPNLSAPINALQAFALGLPTFYQQGFGDPMWTGWTKRYGLFLQDSYRVNSQLTLNMGVRYDLEVNEKVLGTDKTNFFPRFGFAYTPSKNGQFVIRGGYGIYTMPTNLQIADVADALSGKYINQVFVPLTGLAAIINPQTGRPTTSGDIFQGLLRTGVIGRRPITAADIAAYGVRPGPGLPLRVEFGSDPVRNGYAQQGSFEMERAFGDYAVSIGYNYNRSLGIARISGRNLYYTGQSTAAGIPVFGRIDPLVLQKNIFTFDGNSYYNAGYIQVNKRLRRNFAMSAHYTWSKAIDDVTDFNSDFSPMDQLNKRAEKGLSSFHHSHRFVANALFQSTADHAMLRGWNYSPILVANSARVFNVLAGVDVNNDSYVTNDRPFRLGRNVGIGPNYWAFDSRLSRRFSFSGDGRRSLEFIAEGFNLFNRTNFRTVNNTVGAIPITALPAEIKAIKGASPTSPLAYTSANDPRQFQIALKLSF